MSSKKKYNQWSEENMMEAIRKYKTGKYGLNEICTLYEIFRNQHSNDILILLMLEPIKVKKLWVAAVFLVLNWKNN